MSGSYNQSIPDFLPGQTLSAATVERVRQRFVGQGLEPALGRKEQDEPRRARELDEAGEARPIALAGSKAPRGRVAWTPEMLADKRVEEAAHLVDLEVWVENQLGEVTAKGSAIVELPARNKGS